MSSPISIPIVSGPASPITLQPPIAAPVLGQVASGALAAQTYFAKITYVSPGGETLASPESSLAVLIDNVLTVAAPPAVQTVPPGAGPTGYNVYASSITGTETKQAGPIALGTNWQMPATGLVVGAAPPVVAGQLPGFRPVTNY